MTFEESVHNVSLTGNEISTILYIFEGYIAGLNPDPHLLNDNDNEELIEEIDNIFEALEQVTDNYHTQQEEINELKAALNDGGKVI